MGWSCSIQSFGGWEHQNEQGEPCKKWEQQEAYLDHGEPGMRRALRPESYSSHTVVGEWDESCQAGRTAGLASIRAESGVSRVPDFQHTSPEQNFLKAATMSRKGQR